MSLARAEADLVSARNELRRYEGLLEAARSRVTKLEIYIEMARRYAERDPEGDESTSLLSRRPRGGKSGEAVETAIAILREERRAMRTRDLSDRLRDRGISVSDVPERETANLSAYLSRASELVGDRRNGWRLKEWERDNPENPWEAGPLPAPTTTLQSAVTSAPASQLDNASQRKPSSLLQIGPEPSTPASRSGFLKADLEDDIPF